MKGNMIASHYVILDGMRALDCFRMASSNRQNGFVGSSIRRRLGTKQLHRGRDPSPGFGMKEAAN